MARRGAALADIKTNEELNELLQTKCIHLLNVYDGFFGPCNAIATNLRDFKMVKAGDDLQVTSVNVDKIDVFKRFRNKSEPAYLMILDGRIINSYYGTNSKELIEILEQEIAMFKSGEQTGRQTFELREMSLLEGQRFRTKREELISNRIQDQLKKQQLVHDYRIQVTDNIMDNVADVGVTVFLPHVMDDKLIENLVEPAAQSNMTMKTHVITKITKEDLEMINFSSQNMSPLLFNHIRDRDVLIVAWKMPSGELRPVDEIFSEFAKSLRAEVEFETKKAQKGKKGKKGGKKKKEQKVEEVIPEEGEQENPPFKLPALPVPAKDLKRVKADPIQIEPIDLQFIESDPDVIKLVSESIMVFTEQRITKMHNKCIKEALVELIEGTKPEEEEEEEGQEKEEKPVKKKKKAATKAPKSLAKGEVIFDPKDKDTAYICPVWTPPTPRSHASILYLYFRRLLSFFLPMDPPGADRYVIVVFPATRHEEILDWIKDHFEYHKDIMAHGLFRGFIDGEDFENTVLVCKTGIEYRMGIIEPNDKFIMKVVSSTEALLSLVDMEPEFISQNEHDAIIESDVIFPLGYVSISEEEAEAEMKFEGLLEDDEEGEGEGGEVEKEGAEDKGAKEGDGAEEGKGTEKTELESIAESTAKTENEDKNDTDTPEKEAIESGVGETPSADVQNIENNTIEKSNAE